MKNGILSFMSKGLDKIRGLKGPSEKKKKEAEVQKIANSYWEASKNSYIGAEELYIKQEEVLLRLFAPKISKNDRILDIGCSNGRFTFLINKQCRSVDAFDLSPHLIRQAEEQAKKADITNIEFAVRDIRHLQTEKTYDHIMCMGVFTAIPDEQIVKEAVLKLPKILKKNGYLVLKDSLASSDSQVYVNNDYAAKYRNELEYKALFEQLGFRVESEEILHTSYMFNQEISSKFLLLKKEV